MDIYGFWNAVISQNKKDLPLYFCRDAIVRWHCTNEQFTVCEYIDVNCSYPGKWQGEIEILEEFGSTVVIAGKVQSVENNISCHVTSFITLKNDKICQMDEYWADDGEIPQWRKLLKIGKPIV